MQTNNSWKWVLITVFTLTLLTACSTATPDPTPIPPTATEVPPTATPVPPTEVPKPSSCEEVDGNCLVVTFDGENCAFSGDLVYTSGPMTFIFINELDNLAMLAIGKHDGGETLQDTAEFLGPEPGYKGWPSWVEYYQWVDASANKSDIWQDDLTPGVYPLACRHENSQKTWFGDGFTVEN